MPPALTSPVDAVSSAAQHQSLVFSLIGLLDTSCVIPAFSRGIEGYVHTHAAVGEPFFELTTHVLQLGEKFLFAVWKKPDEFLWC